MAGRAGSFHKGRYDGIIYLDCTGENSYLPDLPKEPAGLIYLCFPNNPTGAVYTREILEQIARIAEEHDLVVISDELYDQLVYGVEHVCFPSLPGMRQRTVLLGGFSKNYAMTGWRAGFACGPEEIIKGLVRIHQYTIMSAPTMSQMAALEALKNGQPYVLQMRDEYDRRRRLIVSGLNRLGLPTFEPKGAFYAFPDITVTGMDDETFAQKLLEEERVACVPGSSFGAGGEGFVNLGDPLAHSGIYDARSIHAGFQGSIELPSGNYVHSAAQVGEEPDDGKVGARLHGVADQMIHRAEGLVKDLEVALESGSAVNEDRSAHFLADPFDGDVLAMKVVVYVIKVMHVMS